MVFFATTGDSAQAADFDWNPTIGISFANEQNWLQRGVDDDPNTPEDERWGLPTDGDSIFVGLPRAIVLNGAQFVDEATTTGSGSLLLSGGSLTCSGLRSSFGTELDLVLEGSASVVCREALSGRGLLRLSGDASVSATSMLVRDLFAADSSAVTGSQLQILGDATVEANALVVLGGGGNNTGTAERGALNVFPGGSLILGPTGATTGPAGIRVLGGSLIPGGGELSGGPLVVNGDVLLAPPLFTPPGESAPSENLRVVSTGHVAVELLDDANTVVWISKDSRIPAGSPSVDLDPPYVPLRVAPNSGRIKLAGSISLILPFDLPPQDLAVGDRFRIMTVEGGGDDLIEGEFADSSGHFLFQRPDLFLVLRYGDSFVDAVVHEAPVIGPVHAGGPSARSHLGQFPITSDRVVLVFPGSFGSSAPGSSAQEIQNVVAAPIASAFPAWEVATVLVDARIHPDCNGLRACLDDSIVYDFGKSLGRWFAEIPTSGGVQRLHLIGFSYGAVSLSGFEEGIRTTDQALTYVHSTYIDPWVSINYRNRYGTLADFAENYLQECGIVDNLADVSGFAFWGAPLPNAFNVNWTERIRRLNPDLCASTFIGADAHNAMPGLYAATIAPPVPPDPCDFGFSKSPAVAGVTTTFAIYPRGCTKNTSSAITCAYTCPATPVPAVGAASPSGANVLLGIDDPFQGAGVYRALFDLPVDYTTVRLDVQLAGAVGGDILIRSGDRTLGNIDLTQLLDAGGIRVVQSFFVGESVNSMDRPIEFVLIPAAGEAAIPISMALSVSDDVTSPITLFPCGPADLSEPFALLDLADINAFTAGFVAMDPIADLNADGLLDLTDINLFVTSFTAGCP